MYNPCQIVLPKMLFFSISFVQYSVTQNTLQWKVQLTIPYPYEFIANSATVCDDTNGPTGPHSASPISQEPRLHTRPNQITDPSTKWGNNAPEIRGLQLD